MIQNALRGAKILFCTQAPVALTGGLFNRIKGRKTSIKTMGPGILPTLSKDVEDEIVKLVERSRIEDEIVKCLVERSRIGYPCDKTELNILIAEYVKANNIKTPFTDGYSGVRLVLFIYEA